MNKKKIMIVFGTRPEVIKLAPVILELKKYSSKVKPITVTTAQHREMLDQILKIFNLKPDYDLNIMKSNQSLFDVASTALIKLEAILKKVNPDIILIQGDTTTSFITGLAAYFLKIPIGHVEAGLRTHDKYHPFPEEINRRLVGAIADMHFAPTRTSFRNLIRENIEKTNIFVTGNTVIDALLMTVKRAKNFTIQSGKTSIKHIKKIDFGKKIILVTAHRRESFGKPFESICRAIKTLSEIYSDIEIIYPVHLNPNVRKVVNRILKNRDRVHLIPPLEYQSFVELMNKSYIILTDSGGIQEEAPSLGKPVLVMRDCTERPEAIQAGIVKLVGTDEKKIVREARNLLENEEEYEKMANAVNPYGDGKAAKRIVRCLLGMNFKEFNPQGSAK